MSYIQIPSLPAVTGLSGSELIEVVQAGSSARASLAQINTYIFKNNLLKQEQLSVTSSSPVTFTQLSFTPNGQMIYLVYNRTIFMPIGTNPDFSYSGTTVTWLNSVYTPSSGDAIFAIYSHY